MDLAPPKQTQRLTRSRITLALSVGLLAWLSLSSGCTRSVLPPPTSMSSQRPYPPMSPSVGQYVPRTTTPKIVANPWKPTSPARPWKFIVVHHTATTNGSVESIHEAHLKKKDSNGNHWLGIGYHFVIGNGNGMGDGVIEPTFRWKTQIQGAHAGAGNKEYNEHGIGVCLVGNFEDAPPSAAQKRAVKQLVQTLKAEYGISSTNVVGHKDIRSTECPGKLFPMTEVAGEDPIPAGNRMSETIVPEKMAGVPGSSLR